MDDKLFERMYNEAKETKSRNEKQGYESEIILVPIVISKDDGKVSLISSIDANKIFRYYNIENKSE